MLVPQRSSRQDWVETARKAEDLGYATLLVPDHFDSQLAPMPALMAAADATSTLRVGTLLCNNDFRHPLALAKEAATLDLLSEGRLELGLGAGFREADYLTTGIRYDESAVRVDRFEEAVHLVKGALGPEPVNLSGKFYTVNDYIGLPSPVQSPVPIMIGGGGPRILRFAAREADIVGIAANLGSSQSEVGRDYVVDRIEEKLRWVHEAAGERLSAIELQIMVPMAVVTNDRAGALERAADRLGLTTEQASAALLVLVGSVEEMVETLMARRERFGLSYIVFFDEAMEALAPIVAALAGP
ncbi:MAG: TIGR03621 family F420-dependent LLM class oxidoreductase [Acidimicrobiales bacterium]